MAHYMELWDAYDEKLNKIEGMTLVRGEEVPDGVFHLVCEIIVRHTSSIWTQKKINLKEGGRL